MTAQKLPVIALTIGDPAGIGPEIVLKSLSHKKVLESCTPVILGDKGLLKKVRLDIGLSIKINQISSPAEAVPQKVNLMSVSDINLENFKYGEPRTDLGLVSTFYIIKAAELAIEKQVDALVTSPINKAMLIQAGYDYTSHSQMLRSQTNSEYTFAMLVGEKTKITRITSHVSLKQAAELICKDRVFQAIKLTNQCLIDNFDIKAPKIAVCGLNPHASDNGLLGIEESAEIEPAINMARNLNINAIGPLEPDTVFPRVRDGEFDAVICMYHDQGHIAFGLMESGYGVNITLGIPLIRTAPDQGPSYKIAGKGYASESGMIKAIEQAAHLAKIQNVKE